MVYSHVKKMLSKLGVIFTDMDTAVKEYPDIVKKHFMRLVPPNDHKFAALHGALWSGGSFLYIPKGVEVPLPLQSFFMVNAPSVCLLYTSPSPRD
jgi:Fe-S cluster assembly protein SufB